MTACVRSMLCLPRLSESAWRSVASVTNPSETSNLPMGWFCFICSSSAMRNWSSERMPSAIRIWPSGRCCNIEVLIAGSGSPLGLEFRQALHDLLAVEGRRPSFRRLEGQAVVLGGGLALPDMVETDGQVEQVVRIVAFACHRVEIGLLCFGPALLAGVEVAEREIQWRRFGLAGQQCLQATLGCLRIGPCDSPIQYCRLDRRVARVGD